MDFIFLHFCLDSNIIIQRYLHLQMQWVKCNQYVTKYFSFHFYVVKELTNRKHRTCLYWKPIGYELQFESKLSIFHKIRRIAFWIEFFWLKSPLFNFSKSLTPPPPPKKKMFLSENDFEWNSKCIFYWSWEFSIFAQNYYL